MPSRRPGSRELGSSSSAMSPKRNRAPAYFETMVEPRLGPRVEWVGPVDEVGKARLLQGATAFLFTIQWAEPCAVVVPEALACGVL